MNSVLNITYSYTVCDSESIYSSPANVFKVTDEDIIKKKGQR